MRNGMMLLIGAGAVALLGAMVAADAQQRVNPPAPVVHKAFVTLGDRDSAIRHEAWAVIRDQESFDAMWEQHEGEEAARAAQGWLLAPKVDFDRCMVVAVFNAATVNSNSEELVSMEEFDDLVRIRHDTATYQTASFGDAPVELPRVHPYGIFIVPRIDKDVLIEENTQNLLGAPPEWTKVTEITFPHVKNGWYVPGARQEQGE